MINCTRIEFTTGLKKNSFRECDCFTKYRWKKNNQMCILSCEDIEYTEKGWSNPGNNFCTCITGFIWNANKTQCEFNCSGIKNSTGLANGSVDHCSCSKGNEWNSNLMMCTSKKFDVLLVSIVGIGVTCKFYFNLAVAALVHLVIIVVKKKLVMLSYFSRIAP